MTKRLLYRDEDNQIKNLPEGKPGQALVVDRFGYAWKSYAASALPFDDISHLGLPDVQAAINHLFEAIGDLKTELKDADLPEYRQSVTDMEQSLGVMQRKLNGVGSTLDNVLQTGGDVADGNKNLEARLRAFKRALKTDGSYDNAFSNAQSVSIQGVIDELFSLVALSNVPGNPIKRDNFGALYVNPVGVTSRPNVTPVSQDGNTINISPAHVAQIRFPNNGKFQAKGGQWNMLDTVMIDSVFDSLSPTGSRMSVLSGRTLLQPRRDGIYLVEVNPAELSLIVSVVIGGEVKGVPLWRGILSEGAEITAAVWVDADTEINSEINLFAQLLA